MNPLDIGAVLLFMVGQTSPRASGASLAPPRMQSGAHGTQSLAPHTGPVFDGRRGQLDVATPRRDATVAVDGKLDEVAWGNAALLTGFSQFFPSDGIAAQDSTEVLVWYSATTLHVGIRAFAPAGSVRATLADRDRISQDDNVQLFLGTYGDSRQAMVFSVNPFGIQSDGVLTETGAASGGGFFGGTARSRENADLAPDYVWQSKGHLTDYGYEVELAIPFKSLRYRAGDVQQWQLNVIRTVQASGHEETWAPALRANASFLAQSGHLSGLRNLRRGLTVDLIPTITSSAVGTSDVATSRWGYSQSRPELGGSARWGITSNLTLAGTANPDFSQVEADATQFQYDPRRAVFFPERRPFFLESQEQFTTPNQLIYTRRIVQPVAATKLTGKHQGFDIGVLSAVDSRDASATGDRSPLYNIVRVQRDLGATSRMGLAYTDKIDGTDWNRVLGIDGRVVQGIQSTQWQLAASATHRGATTTRAPLWNLSTTRNGSRYYSRYSSSAISGDFDAQSGFIARAGVANFATTHRYTRLGGKGARLEVFAPELFLDGTWRYDDLVNRRPAQDVKFHVRLNTRFRGGWQVGAQALVEEFSYDRDLYQNYYLFKPRTGGLDTVAYTGTPNLPNLDWVLSMGTPEFRTFSFNTFVIVGQDENFPEWSSAKITSVQGTLNVRPTEQLRLAGTLTYDAFDRKTDGSRVQSRGAQRLRMEYQVTRQMFVRLIGEYSKTTQDALRDDSRTNLPVYLRSSTGTYARAEAFERARARLDFLFSYLPSPGTVFYVGYGDALQANRPAGPDRLQRSRDVFFTKLSYLFRMQ
ncbi:MAG: carbohydrate binding family 9 domain-containing protein [Gemmatimonadaceae bacterium]|nr:carbohydrate binding family 9 domain-containing protein [Gemmatimonadaceae bacterium]